MRNHGYGMGLCEGGDFAGLRDAAHAVGVELDVIESVRIQQLTESVKGEFMLSARDGNSPVGLQLCVTMDVLWDYGLFQPSEMKRLEQRQHSLGVVESPTHVCVRHDINAIADGLTDGANQFKVSLHASRAVGRSPSEAELHGLVALIFVSLGFCCQLAEIHTVEAGGIDRNPCLRPAAKQAIDGLVGRLAEQIPQCDVDGTDGDHADSLASERQCLAIQVLPQPLDVPRVLSNQQGFQIEIDDLFCNWRRQSSIAQSDSTVVGEHFDNQPVMKRKSSHRGFGQ